MIEATELSRNYGDFCAVKDVSFSIKQGEIVGLLGHNGAGKTTIMKMLTGFLEPTSGRVVIDGLELEKDLLAAQEKIGYLPENVPLYSDMTVLDSLEFVSDLRSISVAKRGNLLKQAIEKVSLQSKAKNSIATLSKGFKQRVGVAQAILHQPQILILDEPTNGLDPSQIQEMRNLIKELGQNSTVILSTHIMQEVEAVCDRVLILQQGELVVDSSLDDLKSSGKIIVKIDREQNDLETLLKDLPGSNACEFSGREGNLFTYKINPGNGVDVLPSLAEKVVSKGWKLFSIYPEEQNLESIFKDVSSN